MRTTFVLSFNEEASALAAAVILNRRAFEVRVVGPGGGIERWSVHALKDVPGPVISRGFGVIELQLGWLARRLGGRYEGHDPEWRR